MERDFEIGSLKFKLNKIDALRQFHIVRRLAPILGELIPMAQKFSKLSPAQLEEDQLESLAPIMNGLARLSDEDSNTILVGLLSAVEMQQETGNWARVASNGQLMFANLELPVLLQAAGRSFMYNMAGFFAVLPQVSKSAASNQSAK